MAPPPAAPAAKAKTAAVDEKKGPTAAKVEPPAPKTAPVAVVPVPTPTAAAASPEEVLAEEEAPAAAEEESITTPAAAEETLSPIATTLPKKEKAKKDDKGKEDPELAKIPLFSQLPAEVQQGLPDLHISFHSYSIKPAARLVSISGKILHEGEAFDDTVKLETITAQGVIMKVKDRRFRLKVNPSSRL